MTDDQRLNREGKVVLNEEVINRISILDNFYLFQKSRNIHVHPEWILCYSNILKSCKPSPPAEGYFFYMITKTFEVYFCVCHSWIFWECNCSFFSLSWDFFTCVDTFNLSLQVKCYRFRPMLFIPCHWAMMFPHKDVLWHEASVFKVISEVSQHS